jgi:hypothetical protein
VTIESVTKKASTQEASRHQIALQPLSRPLHSTTTGTLPSPMNVLEKVRSIHAALQAGMPPAKAADEWALAGRLLTRLTRDTTRADQIVKDRDLDGLGLLLDGLEGKITAVDTTPKPTFPAEEMQKALRAFLKRLHVTKLADESRLGGRYTSAGRHSAIGAMQPPDGFPDGIWDALARAGKLKDLGQGFYGEA